MSLTTNDNNNASSPNSTLTATNTNTVSTLSALDNESHQLTLLGRTLGPETVQHFATNQYFCGNRTTAVKILRDILALVHEFKMLHRVTTWGETSQKRLCVFGILPVVFGGAQNANKEKEKLQQQQLSNEGNNNSAMVDGTILNEVSSSLQNQQQQQNVYSFLQPPTKLELGIPVQVWLSSNYPVDPPQLYVVPSPDFGELLVANHPIVDRSGTIYAPLLASWNPAESTLTPLLKQVQRIFGVIPPLWIDDRPVMNNSENNNNDVNNLNSNGDVVNNNGNSPSLSSAGGSPFVTNNNDHSSSNADESSMCVVCLCEEKDTVLVPCGHYVLCSSCSTSVQTCPICRGQIRLRQRVFL